MVRFALITGCSDGGIGNALARSFASQGIKVFATARDATRMENLANWPNITLLTLDVTSSQHIADTLQKVSEETGGKLDYLVNNSGQHYLLPTIDSDIETAKELFDVNFWAVLQMTRAFTPLLMKAKGTIINIGSITGVTPFPFMGVYSASKAALHALSTTLRLELAPFHVDVVTVLTGAVKTQLTENAVKLVFPETSRYFGYEDLVTTAIMSQASEAMPVDVYANRVVADILMGKTGILWHGTSAGLTRWVVSWLPEWVQASRNPHIDLITADEYR